MNHLANFLNFVVALGLGLSSVSYAYATPAILDPGFISIMNKEEQSETLFKMILDTSILNYSAVQVQSGNFLKCLAKKMEELTVSRKDKIFDLSAKIQLDAMSCDDVSMGVNKLSLEVSTVIECGSENKSVDESKSESITWNDFKNQVLNAELCKQDVSSSLLLTHRNSLRYEFVLDEAHPEQLAVVKNEVVISSENGNACEWQVKDLEAKKWLQTPGTICKYSQETILDASKVERINYFKKTEMNFELENSLVDFSAKKLITDKTVVVDSKISNSDGI